MSVGSQASSTTSDGGVAAAPKTRDFAMAKRGVRGEKMHTIPIRAAKEEPSIWQRTMKVTTTAFSKMGGK